MLAVGIVELAVTWICLFGQRLHLKAILVAWLASSFAVYRIGLIAVDYQKPCSCLGNVTDALGIPPTVASAIAQAILVYLLLSSYAALLWFRQQNRAGSTDSVAKSGIGTGAHKTIGQA